jgi:hypothetical protein
MLFPDVNVLDAAHRTEHPDHQQAKAVLDQAGTRGFALCAHTWNGFLRLVTHPTVSRPPTPMRVAAHALDAWRSRPDAQILHDGPGSLDVFLRLCREQGATGNAVYDLHLAALAIIHRCLLVSNDLGFARVPGLHWKPTAALA